MVIAIVIVILEMVRITIETASDKIEQLHITKLPHIVYTPYPILMLFNIDHNFLLIPQIMFVSAY